MLFKASDRLTEWSIKWNDVPDTTAGADCGELNTDLTEIMTTEDPGNSNFSDTGTEQDALAEYLLATYPNAENAYNEDDTIADETLFINRLHRRFFYMP